MYIKMKEIKEIEKMKENLMKLERTNDLMERKNKTIKEREKKWKKKKRFTVKMKERKFKFHE